MPQVNPYAQEDYAALVQALDGNIATFRDYLNSRPEEDAGNQNATDFSDIDTRLKVCKELPNVLKARNSIYLMASGQDADAADAQPEAPRTAAQMLQENQPNTAK